MNDDEDNDGYSEGSGLDDISAVEHKIDDKEHAIIRVDNVADEDDIHLSADKSNNNTGGSLHNNHNHHMHDFNLLKGGDGYKQIAHISGVSNLSTNYVGNNIRVNVNDDDALKSNGCILKSFHINIVFMYLVSLCTTLYLDSIIFDNMLLSAIIYCLNS